jgi:hypothetical protein
VFSFVLTEKQQGQLEVLEKLHTAGIITKIQLERQKVSLGLVPGTFFRFGFFSLLDF